jgi:cytochrome oxidase Cu insertion factor (SCO1/SenC/PrrC family)
VRTRAAALALTLGALIGLAGGTALPAEILAHEAVNLEDSFIKGVFSPAFVPPAPGSYELPAIRKVGSFVLRDSAGQERSTRAVMAGKVAVVSFIYTACSDRLGCPLASVAMRDLQSRIRDEGMQRAATLVTISFDPERDTPAQLAKYARVYGADPTIWRFLAPPTERALEAVLQGYGQDRTPARDERGRFIGRYRHVLKVFLLDQEGYVRNIYSAGFLVPEVVVNDIKTLLSPPGLVPAAVR